MSYLGEIIVEARRTVRLAVPIIVGQVGQHVLHLIDAIMIGQVGRVPLAASAFAGGLVALMMMVAIGLLSSISVLVARADGRADEDGCRDLFRHGVGLALAIGVLLGVVASVGVYGLRWLGQPPEVELESRAYFVILGWSAVPGLVFLAIKQYCEGRSRPTPPMAVMLATVVLNVFFNWILIFGKFGAPALGLAGAGWATLLARAIGCLVLLFHVVRSPEMTGGRGPVWWGRLDWPTLARLFRVGFPISMQLLFEAGVFTAGALLMGWLGTVQLAAHQIALSCIALIFMVPLGISVAVGVRVGAAVGEGDARRVRVIGHSAIGTALIFMSLSALFLWTAGEVVAAVFVDDVVAEAPVVRLAGTLLAIASLFQLVDGVQVVAIGALRGLLDVKVPTVFTFVAYWLVGLPLAYVGAFILGFDAVGVWSGLAAGLAVSAVCLAVRFEVLARRLGDGAQIGESA